MKTNLPLPDSVASIQDLMALILEIQQYTKWFSHNAILKRVNSKKKTEPITISPRATQLLHDWDKIQPINTRSLDALIDTLNLYKNTAPTLTITLAAPPTNDIKETLTNWCRKNIAPNSMVTFRFNATILGGLVVQHGSRIFDWSFRRLILNGRGKFPEVLRRV
jgi:DNA-binding Xre family transcriptional regulator